jgi:FMN reductase
MNSSEKIRIAAVIGSIRDGNYTAKAMAVVSDEFQKYPNIDLDVIDPAEIDLAPPGRVSSSEALDRLRSAISEATGMVISTPEYHGSYSSVIKLVIENLDFPSAMSGKPVALLGVAAGRIGAIKALEHLRSVCSHVGAIVLPGPVSVAQVNKTFDAEGNCLDPAVEERLRELAGNLIDYIREHMCPEVSMEQMVRSK